VDAAPDLLVGDQGEEALDLIDPGRGGRREVDVPARPLGQPVPDRLGLVGGVSVHHQMHVEGSAGTLASIWSRNFLNSLERCFG
jgi:hypothetical protein